MEEEKPKKIRVAIIGDTCGIGSATLDAIESINSQEHYELMFVGVGNNEEVPTRIKELGCDLVISADDLSKTDNLGGPLVLKALDDFPQETFKITSNRHLKVDPIIYEKSKSKYFVNNKKNWKK